MNKLFYILIIGVLLVSCQKEYPYPTKDSPNKVPTVGGYDTNLVISRSGKFVIIDAVMYIDNNETGERIKFNHFGPNKKISSMRWGGSEFDIETIIQDSTTYSFWTTPNGINGMARFVLNDDYNSYYMVNYMGMYTTIVEDPTHGQQNMGGSARPFFGYTISKKDSLIGISIGEMVGGINGYNCHYRTELTLKKIESW